MKNLVIIIFVVALGLSPNGSGGCITDFNNEIKSNPALKAAYDNDRKTILKGWKKIHKSDLAKDPDKCRVASKFQDNWSVTGDQNSITIIDGNGKQIGHITDSDVTAPGGGKGDWNSFLNIHPPLKNTSYNVDGYIYKTDGQGRVNEVTASSLQNIERGRLKSQQTGSVKIKDGDTDLDEGGHLIAQILNGPGEQINYVPQLESLNQGAWKDMETLWKNAIRSDPPKLVEIKIEIVYQPGSSSQRPIRFDVEYWVDGQYHFEDFDNF